MSPQLAGSSPEPKVVQGFTHFHVRFPLIWKFSGLGSDFGPWEQIFYGEFDGRRPKRVLVKVIGE